MRTLPILLLLLPLVCTADSLWEALKVYAPGESHAPGHGVLSVSRSIRLRPGKFGQAYLIERRTLNYADPQEMVLGEGATIAGRENLLRLPSDGFAALPQIGLKPQSRNMLSFQYRGQGKLTVSLTENGQTNLLAEFTAAADFQPGAVLVKPQSDAATLKLRSTAAVELNELMFDRDISQVNTYHPPGQMRGVDKILLDHRLYNSAQGAFSCWLKAPWFGSAGEGTAMGLFLAAASSGTGKKTSQFVVLWGAKEQTGKYESTLHNIHYSGKGGFDCGISFRLSELVDLPVNQWQHLVFNWETADGGLRTSVTVNGKQTFSSSKSKFVPLELQELVVGYVNGSYTNGLLDDIAVFSRPLTQAEIETLVSSGKAIAELIQ